MTASVVSDPNGTGRQGIISWEGNEDEEGHREWVVKHLVRCTDYSDGPATVMRASGLPVIGAFWDYGNDYDPWAFCTPRRTVKMRNPKEGWKGKYWEVSSYFSTRRNSRRCMDESIEDPLLEPDRISGSFVKYTKEVVRDKNGNWIKSSSHELIRGPQVEFDHNRPSVVIERNIGSLGLETFSEMVDTVNDSTLWGLPARRIKLSNVNWTRNYVGTCDPYFTVTYEFDIDFNGFDKEALDEGTKVLHGHWETDQTGTGTGLGTNWVLDQIDGQDPNPNNPQHFDRYKDRYGENARVVLNGAGEPLSVGDSPVFIQIAYYRESNFLLLGIPTTLG